MPSLFPNAGDEAETESSDATKQNQKATAHSDDRGFFRGQSPHSNEHVWLMFAVGQPNATSKEAHEKLLQEGYIMRNPPKQ